MTETDAEFLKRELERAKEQNQTLLTDLKASRDIHNELAKEFADCRLLVKRLETEVEQLKTSLLEKESAITQLNSQITTTQKALETSRNFEKELTKALINSQSSFSLLESELQRISTENEELKGIMNSFETKVENLCCQSLNPEEKHPKILNCLELVHHINQTFHPKKPISKQALIMAASGRSKKMPQFETDFNFKFLGKVQGEYRFEIR